MICAFIDDQKGLYGVVPICRALAIRGVQVAPRTYWGHRALAPSKRALWDITITEILAGYYEPDAKGNRPPESLYGSLKMWAHLRRQDIPVARRTVEPIMRHNGWRGVIRARRASRATEPDPAAAWASDLVGRHWQVGAPNVLLVADFTYVAMTNRFGYTAFVVDAYAGVIPGWECSLRNDTDFVERALRHAAAFRTRQGHPFDAAIHHSDAGRQYTAIHYGEALMLEGSPFRTGPIDTLADLENMISAWVAWYKQHRLMHRLGRRPPVEAEAEYYARLRTGMHTGHTKRGVHETGDASSRGHSYVMHRGRVTGTFRDACRAVCGLPRGSILGIPVGDMAATHCVNSLSLMYVHAANRRCSRWCFRHVVISWPTAEGSRTVRRLLRTSPHRRC